MRFLKFLTAFGFAAFLAGCITAEKPTLSLEERRALQLTAAHVEFTPDARVHVSPIEDQEAARGATREQIAEVEKSHIRAVVSSDFMAVVGSRLNGTRPVAARITIKYFNVPGAVAAVLGGSTSSGLIAGVDLVDVKTGQTLVSAPPGKITSEVYRPAGVLGLVMQAASAKDPVDTKVHEMAQKFAAEYAGWVTSNN
ncbi:MAG: hypothetical protein KGL46_10780 [Hyphomicrobiales bacterium]|nr:hypothetical protein [Hyphomicrobiales bacterium]